MLTLTLLLQINAVIPESARSSDQKTVEWFSAPGSAQAVDKLVSDVKQRYSASAVEAALKVRPLSRSTVTR